ncbi:malonyl-CoA synthase [Sphingopyxis sp. JAI128]|uniref:malonate--CoA ligase n=1 Tax=Sphingopyxis sp. JAI128 TaxID=2723066 RepID=UPI00161E6F5C|nr:malonyl-CoA synthase [Sphingopyxis sp. JAI128]MBB6427137.1 malonyl-CoA/methylmalonyl-CoA synthetase [Sphingopyxis sp. JAI128]
MSNLYTRLLASSPSKDEPFAILPDGRVINYGALDAMSGRFANLLGELGVGQGDRVAVQCEKSIELVALYLGTVRAGAVFLPLNPAYTPNEVAYFLGDSEATLFVCRPDTLEALRPVANAANVSRIETLGEDGSGSLADAAGRAAPGFSTVAVERSTLAAILYTSGTTGRSKGAMITHENLASNALMLKDYWAFAPSDVLLHALPIFHTHGLFVAINTIMSAGASMRFLPRFDLDAIIAALPHCTTMMGVPTFYSRLVDDPRFNKELVRDMRLFISGSAPLSADMHRAFEARSGHAILERYGMTETNMNTSNPYEGSRRAGTVGFPLPGVDIRITDAETHLPVPVGEVGIIEIRGPNVFRGYWRQPEKTASEFRDGWFVSGDLGRIDDEGYISIVGREKDLIISGGLNIYPAEIEAVIDEIPEVRESAVIGIPHPDLGEAVVAIVAGQAEMLSEEKILSILALSLARFKQPRAIRLVDELPRNSMAKIQKAALRDQYRYLFSKE